MITELEKITLTHKTKRENIMKTIEIGLKDDLRLLIETLSNFGDFNMDKIMDAKLKKIEEEAASKRKKKLILYRNKELKNFVKIPQIITFNRLTEFKTIKVAKEEVHKNKTSSVLIEKIVNLDEVNLNLFTGDPSKTSEIALDHLHDDHVEAIFLGEICRQAGMATLNNIIGSNTSYYIVEEVKHFINKVRRDVNVVIQTLPVIEEKANGFGVCYYSLFQNNKICMAGYYLVNYSRGVYGK